MRVARHFQPMLVNTVVGFIGPEYLYDGKQIARAGLEDHFCGKLLGLPMGCDVCYTNHAEADQDDMDALLTLLGAAGVNYIMGVPGADDVMLNYQSTSFHDALYLRTRAGAQAGAGVRGSGWQARVSSPGARGPSSGKAADRMSQICTIRLSLRSGCTAACATPARVGLGRTGVSQQTRDLLDFQRAHAQARDAVHARLEAAALAADLAAITGWQVLRLHSAAADRTTYLQRPDLGRRLDEASRASLAWRFRPRAHRSRRSFGDCCRAACAPLLKELLPRLEGWRLAPVCVVEQGRVAIGDEIGAALGAQISVVLIGERPGLSSPDSLGAYITWDPRSGPYRRRAQLHLQHPRRGPELCAGSRATGLLSD